MIKFSSSTLLTHIVRVLSVVLVAKIISVVAWWYLPSEGEELQAQNSYTFPYMRVDFKNMFPNKKVLPTKKPTHVAGDALNINNLVLKGLYGEGEYGFAIVAKKSSANKTKILSVTQQYGGYTLKAIFINYVIFTKNSQEYILKLDTSKHATKNYVQPTKKQVSVENGSGELQVSKKDITYYSKHPTKIWKDIGIQEIKKDGKIAGFKVTKIRPNSKMATIGLKVGDVIIRANNVELQSYRDAIKLYKNIDKIDTIELVVLRNNQEKEIVYEIR